MTKIPTGSADKNRRDELAERLFLVAFKALCEAAYEQRMPPGEIPRHIAAVSSAAAAAASAFILRLNDEPFPNLRDQGKTS